MKKTKRFVETIVFSGATFVEGVDGGPRLIKGVALLGGTARRGKDSYDYPVSTMETAVRAGKYDGCRCFINHPSDADMKSGRRDLMNLAGVCKNARVEDNRIKGDVQVLDDPMGDKFWNIARHMPEAASCSHIANATLKREGNKMFIEEIKEVLSVDLVVQGATTDNVFESDDQKGNTMEYPDITIDELRLKRPDLVKMFAEEGAKTRDDEVKTLTESNKDLKGKLDDQAVKEAQAQRKADVSKVLEESKLPAVAKTDLFREQLEGIEGDNFDAQAKKLIEDRMSIVGGVKGMGGRGKTDDTGGNGRGSAMAMYTG